MAAAASYGVRTRRGVTLRGLNRLLLAAVAFTVPWATGIPVFTGASIPVALVLLAVAVGALAWMQRRHRSGWGWPEWTWVLLMSWALLSNLWTSSPETTATWTYYYAVSMVLFILVRRTVRSHGDWAFVGQAYLLGCLAAAAALLFEWQHGLGSATGRYAVASVNANHTAYSFATALPVAAALAFSRGPLTWRRLAILSSLAVALGFGIMLTGCRSAMLAMGVGLLVICLRVAVTRPVRGILLLGAGALLLWHLYAVLPEVLRGRLASVTYASHGMTGSDHLSGRLEVWPIAARLFAQHPIHGIGLGAFIDSNPRGIATHNLFLGLAAELGLVGLFLYVATVWSALAKPLGSGIRHWAFWAALALASVWLAIALSGAWDASIVAWFAFAWFSVTPGASLIRPRAAVTAPARRPATRAVPLLAEGR